MSEKACDGGRIGEDGDMAECLECGTRIQWDLRDDAFWGFQNCSERTLESLPADPAVVAPVDDATGRPRATDAVPVAAALKESR